MLTALSRPTALSETGAETAMIKKSIRHVVTGNPPCQLSAEDDWQGFAKRAFEGPVPRGLADLHVMRAKELGMQNVFNARDFGFPGLK